MINYCQQTPQAYHLLIPEQIATNDGSGVATMLSHVTSTHALNKNLSLD